MSVVERHGSNLYRRFGDTLQLLGRASELDMQDLPDLAPPCEHRSRRVTLDYVEDRYDRRLVKSQHFVECLDCKTTLASGSHYGPCMPTCPTV